MNIILRLAEKFKESKPAKTAAVLGTGTAAVLMGATMYDMINPPALHAGQLDSWISEDRQFAGEPLEDVVKFLKENTGKDVSARHNWDVSYIPDGKYEGKNHNNPVLKIDNTFFSPMILPSNTIDKMYIDAKTGALIWIGSKNLDWSKYGNNDEERIKGIENFALSIVQDAHSDLQREHDDNPPKYAGKRHKVELKGNQTLKSARIHENDEYLLIETDPNRWKTGDRFMDIYKNGKKIGSWGPEESVCNRPFFNTTQDNIGRTKIYIANRCISTGSSGNETLGIGNNNELYSDTPHGKEPINPGQFRTVYGKSLDKPKVKQQFVNNPRATMQIYNRNR